MPYEKGYLLLRAIEEAVGRAAFDAFLSRYIAAFRWRTLTSEDFVQFLRRELPQCSLDLAPWLDGPGIPPGAPAQRSARLEALAAIGAALPSQAQLGARGWAPIEWVLYLDRLPRPAPLALCAALDAAHGLTASTNFEVLASWLLVAVHAGHDAALPRVQEVLGSVGRMKYLKPLYRALVDRPETRGLARASFAEHAASYHPIARQVIEPMLRE